MAKLWLGHSPNTETRHHKHFYPACIGTCKPILNYMLQCLQVEPTPLDNITNNARLLETVYEDRWILIVNKPAGMLSVPGKSNCQSVYSIVREQYPFADGPLLVHRLDMATSGLLLIAKNKEVHKTLQKMFAERTISKCYHAVLDGIVEQDKGSINLPLCFDPLNRPRQVVHHEYGKKAITTDQVIKRLNCQTYI